MDKTDTMDFACGTGILKEGRLEATIWRDKSALTCGCPVAAFPEMISGKYKLRIVWDLQDGPKRYGEIRTGLLRGSAAVRKSRPACSAGSEGAHRAGLIDRRD